MQISEEQRSNMRVFLEEKVEILKHGEMKDNQFETLAELGFGNGGVVLKVRHKPSNAVMARKVYHSCVWYSFAFVYFQLVAIFFQARVCMQQLVDQH